jgi:hypothetical protein
MGNRGISIAGTGGGIEGLSINSCNIEGTDGAGVYLGSYVQYVTLLGNIFNGCCKTDANGDLATVAVSCSNVTITGGQFLASYCSAVRGQTNGLTISGVHFTDCSRLANNTYDWFSLILASASISGCTFEYQTGNKARYVLWAYLGSSISFTGNTFLGTPYVSGIIPPTNTGEPVSGLPSSPEGLYLKNNAGLNPIGQITNPILTYGAHSIIGLGGTSATVTASTAYIITSTDCFINTTDSSNTNCSIVIKDNLGNTIQTISGALLPAYRIYLPIGYTINWGAFTGTAPTVTVFGN